MWGMVFYLFLDVPFSSLCLAVVEFLSPALSCFAECWCRRIPEGGIATLLKNCRLRIFCSIPEPRTSGFCRIENLCWKQLDFALTKLRRDRFSRFPPWSVFRGCDFEQLLSFSASVLGDQHRHLCASQNNSASTTQTAKIEDEEL